MFRSGEITSTSGTLPSGVMPAKSCTGSYGLLAWMAGVVTSALECTRTVWPSGSDLATAAVPTVVPPPVRFSIRKVCPRLAATRSNTVRGNRSVALPGANGTITRTVLLGQATACASSGAIAETAAAAAITVTAHSRTRHELDIPVLPRPPYARSHDITDRQAA